MNTQVVTPKVRWTHALDAKPGLRMMADSSVPIQWKALSYLAGVAITAVLEFLEIPLTLFAVMMPGGILIDALIDGGEALVVPIWLACILLPKMYKPRTPYLEVE